MTNNIQTLYVWPDAYTGEHFSTVKPLYYDSLTNTYRTWPCAVYERRGWVRRWLGI